MSKNAEKKRLLNDSIDQIDVKPPKKFTFVYNDEEMPPVDVVVKQEPLIKQEPLEISIKKEKEEEKKKKPKLIFDNAETSSSSSEDNNETDEAKQSSQTRTNNNK